MAIRVLKTYTTIGEQDEIPLEMSEPTTLAVLPSDIVNDKFKLEAKVIAQDEQGVNQVRWVEITAQLRNNYIDFSSAHFSALRLNIIAIPSGQIEFMVINDIK